jgi:hypothetical protein
MQRRDLTRVLVASATGATLLGRSAKSQTPRDPRHPHSDAETAAGITPKNYDHPPGSVLRYGADPSGVRDSSEAWRDALKANSHVFDDHPGGGSYLFTSEVTISRYPVTIVGSAKQIGGGTGGTIITLAAAAGAGKAVLRTASFASCVRVERIRFAWQALNIGQIGLSFAELRSSRILDCAFVGDHSPSNTVVGIQFDGGGTYTGDVTVRESYFSGLLRAIDLQGVCTSVRILSNELYGYVNAAGSRAIRLANRATETVIAFNMIEGWTIGIDSSGGYIKQIGNTYETNGTNFRWLRGAGNDRIWNMSFAEAFVSGGAPIYPMNDNDACMVLGGPGSADLDTMTVNARRGLYSYGRAAKEGDWATDPFSAASYGANNGAEWSVTPKQQTTLEYARIGHTMTVNFRIDAAAIRGTRANQLYIRIPQSQTAAKATGSTCYIDDGVPAIGKMSLAAGSGLLTLEKVQGANFGTGPFSCWGSITFECN